MAAVRGQSFVSSTDLKEQRDQRKECLREELRKEKAKEKERKLKEERKKQTGEDRWLNPLLEDRIKKDHYAKKHKKKSKKQKKKRDSRADSTAAASDSEDEWVESTQDAVTSGNGTVPVSTQLQRDEWMVGDPFAALSARTFSKQDAAKESMRDKREPPAADQPGQHPRELNPYWRDGGKGLPGVGSTGDQAAESTGDSWIHKAFNRVKAQAAEDGISIEEAVAKKWGSMKKLQRLLAAAEATQREPKDTSTSGSSRQGQSWRKQPLKLRQQHLPSSSVQVATEGEQSRDLSHSASSDGDSSYDSRPGSSDEDGQPLTEQQMNKLGADLLRAELMGDEDAVNGLKRKLDAAHALNARRQTRGSQPEDKSTEEVLLTAEDRQGNLYPVQLDAEKIDSSTVGKRRKKKKAVTHDTGGKRVRYYADDDDADLLAMVKQERMTSADDNSASLLAAVGHQGHRVKGDDFSLDDMFESESAVLRDSNRDERRRMDRAVRDHKRTTLKMENCRRCFGSNKFEKHLLVTVGRNICLALPSCQSLVDGHCLLFPTSHIVATTYLDEDVLKELQTFKRALVQMFNAKDDDVLFLESFRNVKGQHHMTIECVPLSRDAGDCAPIYFKKALQEAESEWTQNKKIVDVKAGRGVSSAVPKALPYFAVEFGLDGGFAHVIEDESAFPSYFGHEIVGGILDLEPSSWRRPPRESFERQKKKMLVFLEDWKPHDCTQTA